MVVFENKCMLSCGKESSRAQYVWICSDRQGNHMSAQYFTRLSPLACLARHRRLAPRVYPCLPLYRSWRTLSSVKKISKVEKSSKHFTPSTHPTPVVIRTWVDRLPAKIRPYLYLTRIDKPIGTLLLFYPCG